MIDEFHAKPIAPTLGQNRPLLQIVRPAPPKSPRPSLIRINWNRDLVREVIEENVLPDLLDTADELLARGIPARVTISDSDELPSQSRVGAWAKIEVYPEGGTKPVILGFVGEVVERGWHITAHVLQPGRLPERSALFRGPLSELPRFTRRHLSLLSQSLVPAA